MSQPPKLPRDHVFGEGSTFLHKTTAAATRSLLTDLSVAMCPLEIPSAFDSSSRKWNRLEKDLFLHTLPDQQAWLYVECMSEETIRREHLVIVDIKVSSLPPDCDSNDRWESRPSGIWLLRRPFHKCADTAVTDVDVLFGADAVDPRRQWTLLDQPILLYYLASAPVARLSMHRRRSKHVPAAKPILRVNESGRFKIVQISDTHMVTGVGVSNDAIDADGNYLPDSEADPLTVDLIGKILDMEKPDLVVLTGDQVHHDVLDTQSALFKVVTPIIERGIPFAAVFGNHDSEGKHALSRQ